MNQFWALEGIYFFCAKDEQSSRHPKRIRDIVAHTTRSLQKNSYPSKKNLMKSVTTHNPISLMDKQGQILNFFQFRTDLSISNFKWSLGLEQEFA